MRNRGIALLVFAVAVAVSVGSSWAASGRDAAIGGVEDAPVTQLPPGLVILAHVYTPQGVIELGLHRIRYLGKVRLCLNEADQPGFPSGGPETCANYPVGPSSGQGIGQTHLFLGPPYGGICSRKQFLLVAGVVLRAGLTGWVQAGDLKAERMQAAAVPKAFGVAGPLVYAVIRGWQPFAITLRDSTGKSVSHVSLAGGGDCHT